MSKATTTEDLIRKIRVHVETTEDCIPNFNLGKHTEELLKQDNDLFKEIIQFLSDQPKTNEEDSKIQKAINEFERLKLAPTSLKDAIYLDGVLAVLEGIKSSPNTPIN